MLAGGIVILTDASVAGFLAVAVGFIIVGVIARSSLLIALAVLALSSCIGARTGYMHATYFLGIEEPLLTIVIFSVVALAAYQASWRVPARVRAARHRRGAHVDLSGQLRLLGRLAVRRPTTPTTPSSSPTWRSRRCGRWR